MRKKLYPAMVVMLAMVFMATPLLAGVLYTPNKNEVVEPLKSGAINWTLQTIRVIGSGAPNPDAPNVAAARLGAERVAKLDAMRNALEAIQGVRIDSQTTVRNAMLESDVIRSQVEGYIYGARVVDTRYLSDGAVQVTVEVSLRGAINNVLLPEDTGTKDVPKTGNPVYTGLIINAKGLKVRPALSPKVLDGDGREVYGSAFVSREYAIEQGMVGYAKDLSAAQQNERVTDNPLIVKAKKTSGSGGSDIVVDSEAAQSLRDASQNLSFLEQCRVMIVVD
jgi:hypothetical protein